MWSGAERVRSGAEQRVVSKGDNIESEESEVGVASGAERVRERSGACAERIGAKGSEQRGQYSERSD